jgi:tRNA-uridine 2-sulfurtransferase
VPSGRYSKLIERLMPEAVNPGDIVHVDGRVLGRHAGIIHYTIGQRRGLGIAAAEPLYVIALDARNAKVVVGPREALATRRIRLRDINWLGDGRLEDIGAGGLDIAVRVRSTREPTPARLTADGAVELLEAETGVSPGQACVFYASGAPDARVLGGGFIRASEGQGQPPLPKSSALS